jgi:hypothetical protein
VMSVYRMLQAHCIAGVYFDAGSIASTADVGGTLPTNWVPTPNVEPLDTAAVNAFYAAGPTGRGGGGSTYWLASSVPGNPLVMSYSLTGLGTGLPPVCA